MVEISKVMCFICTAVLILLQISCQKNSLPHFCKNEACSDPIDIQKFPVVYSAGFEGVLNVKRGAEVKILGIPKDSVFEYYYVQVEEKTGYLPKRFFQAINNKGMKVAELPVPMTLIHKKGPPTILDQSKKNIENENILIRPVKLDSNLHDEEINQTKSINSKIPSMSPETEKLVNEVPEVFGVNSENETYAKKSEIDNSDKKEQNIDNETHNFTQNHETQTTEGVEENQTHVESNKIPQSTAHENDSPSSSESQTFPVTDKNEDLIFAKSTTLPLDAKNKASSSRETTENSLQDENNHELINEKKHDTVDKTQFSDPTTETNETEMNILPPNLKIESIIEKQLPNSDTSDAADKIQIRASEIEKAQKNIPSSYSKNQESSAVGNQIPPTESIFDGGNNIDEAKKLGTTIHTNSEKLSVIDKVEKDVPHFPEQNHSIAENITSSDQTTLPNVEALNEKKSPKPSIITHNVENSSETTYDVKKFGTHFSEQNDSIAENITSSDQTTFPNVEALNKEKSPKPSITIQNIKNSSQTTFDMKKSEFQANETTKEVEKKDTEFSEQNEKDFHEKKIQERDASKKQEILTNEIQDDRISESSLPYDSRSDNEMKEITEDSTPLVPSENKLESQINDTSKAKDDDLFKSSEAEKNPTFANVVSHNQDSVTSSKLLGNIHEKNYPHIPTTEDLNSALQNETLIKHESTSTLLPEIEKTDNITSENLNSITEINSQPSLGQNTASDPNHIDISVRNNNRKPPSKESSLNEKAAKIEGPKPPTLKYIENETVNFADSSIESKTDESFEYPSEDPLKRDGSSEDIFGVEQNISDLKDQDVEIIEDTSLPVYQGDEKSSYEIAMDYLPDFASFQFNFTAVNDGIELVKSFFSFQESDSKAATNEFCDAEQFCGTDRLNSLMENDRPVFISQTKTVLPYWGEITSTDKQQIVWTSGVLSISVFILIFILMLINNVKKKNRTNALITKINQLENKLLVTTKEIYSLQEQLKNNEFQVKEKQNAVEARKLAETYELKINQYKKKITALEDNVSYLEKELENVSTSALEMHKLLENSLITQAQSKSAADENLVLRSLTESQEVQIEDLRKENNALVTENQCLKEDNDVIKTSLKKLEKECGVQIKKNLELSEKNQDLTLQLDKEIENSNSMENNYKTQIYQLRSKLEDIEMNFKRSEFQVQELNRAFLDRQEGKAPEEVGALCDDMQLKIQVSTLEAMNVELSGQLKEEKNARRMLEDHVGDVIKQLNNLKKVYETSEKERSEAVTKLQVLTEYFKDKEAQLHKDLETKEKQNSEREINDQMLSQKLASMREEISNLRVQNEELKKEILDQEASYKLQLATAEQKTREHWFALRQADRKYKESQQEAANLRNKILLLETNLSTISQKSEDKNNSGMTEDIPSMIYHSQLSPDLLPYPSPSEFIPPSPIADHSPDFSPPEPLYSPDERLPPLGGRRVPSPPAPLIPDEDEFSVPPPIIMYPTRNRNSVEPPVPSYNRRTPPPNSRHRSQFKPRQPRSSIDSPSSGMSLESLDRSGR